MFEYYINNTNNTMTVGNGAIVNEMLQNLYKNNHDWQLDSVEVAYNGDIMLLGYEIRITSGWDTSPSIATGYFGRIGFFSYTTRAEGQKGIIYVFKDINTNITKDGVTSVSYGYGINLYDIIGAEYQIELLGYKTSISIFNCSLEINVNALGNTYISGSVNKDLGNGETKTRGVTIGLNTGNLATVATSVLLFVTIATSPAFQGFFQN